MKKFFFVTLIFFFSLNLNSEKFSSDEIKNMQKGVAPYILNVCKNKSLCFSMGLKKFKKSLELGNIKHGREFFDECYSQYIQEPVKKVKYPEMKNYYACNKKYYDGLTMETFDKSLNHLFLREDSLINMILRVCKTKHSLLKEKLLNKCIEKQKMNSKFISMYFLYPNTINFDKSFFEECFNKNKKEYKKNKFFVDFYETKICLNRRIKNV